MAKQKRDMVHDLHHYVRSVRQDCANLVHPEAGEQLPLPCQYHDSQ